MKENTPYVRVPGYRLLCAAEEKGVCVRSAELGLCVAWRNSVMYNSNVEMRYRNGETFIYI